MYLQHEQHYIDEYDRETVKLCRDREKRHRQRHEELVSRGDNPDWAELLYKWSIYFDVDFLAGECWEHKTQVIQERMNRDRARDILLATSDPPDHIHCLVCRAKMKVVGKELDEAPAGNQDRVIFFFECLMGCRTRRAFFSTGVELRPKAHLCPKCRHQLKIETVRGSDGLTMTETCPGCGYTDTIRFDLKVPEPQPDPAFVADRQRFCLTDEQGREYLKDKADQDLTNDLAKMREANNALKQMADRIAKIKILTVGDLERRLVALLEKHGYGQLNFNAPDVGKFFIVPFTLRDITKGRKESDAIAEVQKLLKSDLAPSNWRLMTDGIYSQLGILVGRLRGYERESELAELLGESKRKSKQVKS